MFCLSKMFNTQRSMFSPMLPRPEITEYLGITYRRIPILAIGNDVYCDTSLITTALERRFPATKGYDTLFPPTRNSGKADTGLIKAFSKFYADNTLFPPATTLIPWDKLPAAFIKDRSDLRGSNIDIKAFTASQPISQTTISSHLLLIEEQMSDSREWLFDTESPSLADVSVHFVLAWARSFRGLDALFDPKQNPFTMQWLDRLTVWLTKRKETQVAPTVLEGDAAAEKIISAPYEPYNVVGFDVVEAGRLGFAYGDTVQVAPEDTGRNYPTIGKLVALNREEVVLEVRGSKGIIRCHFPRLGFFIRLSQATKL